VPASSSVDRARHAEPVQLAVEVERRIDLVFGRKLRRFGDHLVEDQRVGYGMEDRAAVDELEAPAVRRRRLAREAERLHRGAVDEALTVEEQHEGRRLGRGLVQLLHRRHAFLFELVRGPAADDAHPLALGSALRLLLDHRQPTLQRFDAVPAKFEVVEPSAAHGVRVRVVEARDDRAAARVDRAGVGSAEAHHPRLVPDGNKLAVLNSERGRLRTLFVHGMDLGVGDDEISRYRVLRGGATHRHRHRHQRDDRGADPCCS
jgi:hypothetical protein